jgi:hypothetical protein
VFRLICYIWIITCTLVYADADDDLKMANVGLKLFIATLSADIDLASKIKSEVRVAILCSNRSVGNQIKSQLEQMVLRDLPIVATVIDTSQLTTVKVIGVYAAQSVNIENIENLVNYGISNKVLTYSPFEGDVQRGVAAGMVITDRVTPAINENTIEKSNIKLKPFFLKVAKKF